MKALPLSLLAFFAVDCASNGSHSGNKQLTSCADDLADCSGSNCCTDSTSTCASGQGPNGDQTLCLPCVTTGGTCTPPPVGTAIQCCSATDSCYEAECNSSGLCLTDTDCNDHGFTTGSTCVGATSQGPGSCTTTSSSCAADNQDCSTSQCCANSTSTCASGQGSNGNQTLCLPCVTTGGTCTPPPVGTAIQCCSATDSCYEAECDSSGHCLSDADCNDHGSASTGTCNLGNGNPGTCTY